MPNLNGGVLAPVDQEVTVHDLPVTGQLPPELSGTLIRNGPNPFDGRFTGSDMLSWWMGPAMLHGIAISDGRALWYRNRWVRTGDWARHFAPEAAHDPVRDQSVNVNAVVHAGELLALGEGGLPFVIGPELDTVRVTTFGGALSGGSGLGGMSAHPRPIQPRARCSIFAPTGKTRFCASARSTPQASTSSIKRLKSRAHR